MNQDFFQALIAVLAGGLITMLGWFANYYFSRKKDIEAQQREIRIRYLQQQIEELYAPLWGLLEQSETVYEIARKKLPSDKEGLRRKSQEDNKNSVNHGFNL